MSRENGATETGGFVYDVPLLFAVLSLVGLGIVMVYSASSAVALEKFGSSAFFLKRQVFFALIGIVVLVCYSHIPYRWYRPLTYPLLIVALVLLVAVHIGGLGVAAGGAQRWLRFGPLTFQPAEVARLVLIIYMAYSLSKKQEALGRFSVGLVPHLLILAVFAVLLMMQPDFGSVMIFAALTWLLMFVGGVPLRHLLGALLLAAPVVYLLMVNAAYRLRRLISFLDPWQHPADEGYQMIHSLMAFGSGGLWGAGIGKGYQKLFYLPEPHTDFIFAVIGEELGFWGVLLIIGLFGLILWRGLRIAGGCSDIFGMLLATGIIFALALQVSINMGVCLGLLPTKGLTLPFISYGGTSLLLNMAAVGVLMNIGTAHERRT
ncbi:putative lipid II flippase FtsW [Desulfatitalea alkaliphila]|uniref:Probable peptidoglycan glycosyltransferase FtsW n=1 Tax=Desulfatitalea alkaliphila TaxID=2929485 RepID=A0AA41R6W7_9BACT|nr:putative lipid II flippase FtsW [Desulfatitalea alkaliphila]MCJ8502612.1 putative lipid II flippase FtsW [Desulfatitalea alkaliphila]